MLRVYGHFILRVDVNKLGFPKLPEFQTRAREDAVADFKSHCGSRDAEVKQAAKSVALVTDMKRVKLLGVDGAHRVCALRSAKKAEVCTKFYYR